METPQYQKNVQEETFGDGEKIGIDFGNLTPKGRALGGHLERRGKMSTDFTFITNEDGATLFSNRNGQ